MIVSVADLWINPEKILYVKPECRFVQETKRWVPAAVVHFGEGEPLVVVGITADAFVDRLTTGIAEQERES